MTRVSRTLLALALAAGCGGTETLPSGETASRFSAREARAHFASHPDSARAARDAAVLEMLAPDGELPRAEAALERALASAPDDGLLLFLRSSLRASHGALDAADEDGLRALDVMRTSADALVPALAEAVADGFAIDVGNDELTARRRERARSLLAEPGRLGPLAVGMVAQGYVDDALRRGDVAEARRVQDAVGCIPSFRVAGPFGPREMLGFDRTFPAEALGPLADSYDLGPTRGVQATRTIPSERCAIWLGGGPVPGPGTSYAETFVEVPTEGDYVIVVTTPNSFVLRVDGEPLMQVDRRAEVAGRTDAHAVHLTAGRHELEVKVSSRHPSPLLSVRLTGADGLAPRAGQQGVPALDVPRGGDAASVFLGATLHQIRGNAVAARRAIRPLFRGDEAAPLVLAARVGQLFSDPLLPRDQATDAARGHLRALRTSDPEAWLPVLQLAQLAAEDGRTDEAIASLREAAEHYPEVVAIGLTLVQMLDERGLDAEAETRLDAIAAAHSENCGVLDAQREQAARASRPLAVAALAERAVRCDARSTARLERLVEARDWAGAENELDRLDALRLDGNTDGSIQSRLRFARVRGDEAAEAALLERIHARQPRTTAVVARDVDRLVANGRRAEAVAAIDRAVAEEPTRRMDLRRIRDALSLGHLMDPYRVDGRAALEAYRASGVSYDVPVVYVLDYAATRVFEDGSYVHLVHQIVEVNSEEALDDVGEFHPQGELLSVHTIKRDGRILEPDAIQGLEQLALPRLEVGDFVEYEYVTTNEPAIALEDGIIADRFYFQTFEGPMFRTEYLIVHPDQVPVVFDERGPVGSPAVERRDGLTWVRYRLDQQDKREQEPFSINSREFIPSVAWGVRANWDAFIGALADQLVDTLIRDPDLVEVAQRIVRDAHARTDLDKARALYAWVLENIEDEGGGLFENAAGMVYDRNGSRDKVLQYLLYLLDIPADLVLVRPISSDLTDSPLPEDGVYEGAGLRIHLGDETRFVTAAQRGVPFGWLPFAWLGQQAIVVGATPERIVMPTTASVIDDHTVAITGQMDEEGGAHLVVTETMTGSVAGNFRQMLKQIPEAELEMRFESAYVAPRFSGATLRRLTFESRDDAERPFVMRYEVDVTLAFADREGAVLGMPLPFELGSALAATATRTTTMLIPTAHERVTLDVRLPAGLRAGALPPARRVEGPGGAFFASEARTEGDRLIVRREFQLNTTRVPASGYAEVTAFARGADREESRPIQLLSR